MEAFPLDPARVEVLYVRTDLVSEMAGRPLTDEEARDFVRRFLLLTLDPREGLPGAVPVQVYVDRQADPLNISLVGNSGSGRAVYVGDRFNLKGVGKTVLATSNDPQRSNGALDLVGALWEALCSNVLQTNLRTGTSPALAVVDLRKDVLLPWYKDPIPTGMLIRLDRQGELDRPAHLFFRGQPLAGERLVDMARAFGAQDAEKFVERILHGGWSAGNISNGGCLIDYDSVFAVRGRAPQWSFRPNWPSNFFGLESQGQKILLQALAASPVNGDGLSVDRLHAVFDEARRDRLEERFLDLVGLEPDERRSLFPELYQNTRGEADGEPPRQPRSAPDLAPIFPVSRLRDLVRRFETLAMKMYPHFRATATWDEDNAALSVFDCSRFFRLYPLVRMSGPVDMEGALGLIRNPIGGMITSRETREGGMPDHVRSALEERFGVTSPEHAAAADQEAREFIASYEALLAFVQARSPAGNWARCARAYVVNEERTYMNSRPGHDTLIALLQWYKAGSLSASRFGVMLDLLIAACDRVPRPDARGRLPVDVRVFREGCTSTLVTTDGGFHLRLTLLPPDAVHPESGEREVAADGDQGDGFRWDAWRRGPWELENGGNKQECMYEEEAGRMLVTGPRLPLVRLVAGPPSCRFLCDGRNVPLHPLTRLDRPVEF